jgi:hypothetical protein
MMPNNIRRLACAAFITVIGFGNASCDPGACQSNSCKPKTNEDLSAISGHTELSCPGGIYIIDTELVTLDGLTTVDLPGCRTGIANNPQLVDVSALSDVGNMLEFTNNDALQELHLGTLRESAYVAGSRSLSQASFSVGAPLPGASSFKSFSFMSYPPGDPNEARVAIPLERLEITFLPGSYDPANLFVTDVVSDALHLDVDAPRFGIIHFGNISAALEVADLMALGVPTHSVRLIQVDSIDLDEATGYHNALRQEGFVGCFEYCEGPPADVLDAGSPADVLDAGSAVEACWVSSGGSGGVLEPVGQGGVLPVECLWRP